MSLQGLADSVGKGGDWQGIATANNIENPRFLAPGKFNNAIAHRPRRGAGRRCKVGT